MDRSFSRLIAAMNWNLLLQGMTEENRSQSDFAPTDSQAARETATISDRVQALREKASKLSETLDSVEKSLREAAGETKE
jgi:mannose/fructose-specific phosphotransferase system component IIA